MVDKRVVVVGASSGLGRCIGMGLGERGDRVALLARRKERLEAAAAELGNGAVAIACDVTDADSVNDAIAEAASSLGGLDAVVYAPGVGWPFHIEETPADVWARSFAINATGASLVAAAALPHLQESQGVAMFLSSISASEKPPRPGLGNYVVGKAALDALVDVWRTEHPEVGFTNIIVGDCAGGEGDSAIGFADDWDTDGMEDLMASWFTRNYMTGNLMDVSNLVNAVATVLDGDASVCHRSVTVTPRLVTPEPDPELIAAMEALAAAESDS